MKIQNAYRGTPCPSGHPEGHNGFFADDQPEPALFRCDRCRAEFSEGDPGTCLGVTVFPPRADPMDICAACARVVCHERKK